MTVAGRQQQVDLYAPTHGPKSFLVNGLTDAPHRIRVRPTGTKNDASTGTGVTVDGFVAGTTQVDDTSVAVEYNSWVGPAERQRQRREPCGTARPPAPARRSCSGVRP